MSQEITFSGISVGLFQPHKDSDVQTNPDGFIHGIELKLVKPFRLHLGGIITSVILFRYGIFSAEFVVKEWEWSSKSNSIPFRALSGFGASETGESIEFLFGKAVRDALEAYTPETNFDKLIEIILGRQYGDDGVRFNRAFGVMFPLLYLQKHYQGLSSKTKLDGSLSFPPMRTIIFPKIQPPVDWTRLGKDVPIAMPTRIDTIVVQIEEWAFTTPFSMKHFYAGYNPDSDTLYYWTEKHK